jgi:large conductance mechanosensitive channel
MGALKNLLHEFKQFAVQGNALDLAVGVVIGAAFGGVVKSLVDDVIMPPLGFLTGGVDFSDKLVELKPLVLIAGQKPKPAVDLRYGLFLNNVINFIIVAASVFLAVKLINMLHRKPADPPPPGLTPDQQLLTEIRDLLKERSEPQA